MLSGRPSGRSVPPTRKSLLLRLKDWQDAQSWEEFYRIYETLIRATALKCGLTHPETQEVVQDTLLSVAKKIAGFDYDPELGSFRSWLLQITKRRIIDQFRKRRPREVQVETIEKLLALDQFPEATTPRLEAVWNEEWHQALLQMAQALVRRKVSPKQYRMFELYVLQQKPLKEVTRQLGVHAAQVYMAKYRITRLLKKEVQRLDEEDL